MKRSFRCQLFGEGGGEVTSLRPSAMRLLKFHFGKLVECCDHSPRTCLFFSPQNFLKRVSSICLNVQVSFLAVCSVGAPVSYPCDNMASGYSTPPRGVSASRTTPPPRRRSTSLQEELGLDLLQDQAAAAPVAAVQVATLLLWRLPAVDARGVVLETTDEASPTDPHYEDGCSVCFEAFSSATSPRKLLCGHIFCSSCLTRWYSTRPTCPLCRAG